MSTRAQPRERSAAVKIITASIRSRLYRWVFAPLQIRSKTRFILLIGCGLALLYIYQLAITGQRHGDES
jgi:hypothetical protein